MKKEYLALGVIAAAGAALLILIKKETESNEAATTPPPGAASATGGIAQAATGFINFIGQTWADVFNTLTQGETKREQAIFNNWLETNPFKKIGVSQIGWADFVRGDFTNDQLPGLYTSINNYRAYVANPANFKPGTKQRVIDRYRRAADIAYRAVGRAISNAQQTGSNSPTGNAVAIRKK